MASMSEQMDEKQKKHLKMTTAPVKKLVIELSTPTVISMLVTAIYNIVDTFFVGQIGTNATAGVGLILPVMMVIQAFGFFLGQGSGNFISRMLGAKKDEEAETMASNGTILALIFGALVMAFGLILQGPLLVALGAKEGAVAAQTIAYAGDYYRIILIGAPFMCVSYVLNNQLRYQGNAFFSMIALVSGAVINCALDPLFIFAFHQEVLGAALATVISQTISCIFLFVGTFRSDSLRINIKKFRPTWYYIKNIFVGGAPSLFRQGLQSVAMIILNTAAGAAAPAGNSDAAIAALSIVGKIMMFAFSALLGFGQGFQPICGFNYGAKKYDRVREAFRFCLVVSFAALFVLSVAGYIFAEPLVRLFRDDAVVVEYGRTAMRYQCFTFPMMAVVVMTNMLYQNLGKVIPATVLAVARQGLMFIPAVLLLPLLFAEPLTGIFLSQPAADLLSIILAAPLAIYEYRLLGKMEREMLKSTAK